MQIVKLVAVAIWGAKRDLQFEDHETFRWR